MSLKHLGEVQIVAEEFQFRRLLGPPEGGRDGGQSLALALLATVAAVMTIGAIAGSWYSTGVRDVVETWLPARVLFLLGGISVVFASHRTFEASTTDRLIGILIGSVFIWTAWFPLGATGWWAIGWTASLVTLGVAIAGGTRVRISVGVLVLLLLGVAAFTIGSPSPNDDVLTGDDTSTSSEGSARSTNGEPCAVASDLGSDSVPQVCGESVEDKGSQDKGPENAGSDGRNPDAQCLAAGRLEGSSPGSEVIVAFDSLYQAEAGKTGCWELNGLNKSRDGYWYWRTLTGYTGLVWIGHQQQGQDLARGSDAPDGVWNGAIWWSEAYLVAIENDLLSAGVGSDRWNCEQGQAVFVVAEGGEIDAMVGADDAKSFFPLDPQLHEEYEAAARNGELGLAMPLEAPSGDHQQLMAFLDAPLINDLTLDSSSDRFTIDDVAELCEPVVEGE